MYQEPVSARIFYTANSHAAELVLVKEQTKPQMLIFQRLRSVE